MHMTLTRRPDAIPPMTEQQPRKHFTLADMMEDARQIRRRSGAMRQSPAQSGLREPSPAVAVFHKLILAHPDRTAAFYANKMGIYHTTIRSHITRLRNAGHDVVKTQPKSNQPATYRMGDTT